MTARLTPLLLVLLLAAPALAQRDRGETMYERSFDFRPGDVLEVSTSSPSVVVRTGGQSGAHVRVVGSGPDVQRAFEDLRFTAERRGNRLSLRTDQRRRMQRGRSPSFTIEVTIPDRADLQLATSSGSIRVGEVRGNAEIGASSGSVHVEGLEGDRIVVGTSSGSVRAGRLTGKDRVAVSASSGSVTAERVAGGTLSFQASSGSITLRAVDAERLDAQASSGSISVAGVAGRAVLRASSGGIRAEGLRAPVEAQTGSGSIRLAMDRAVPVRVQTGSGSVELRAPASLRATLDLSGGSIRLDDAFRFQGDRERRRLRGALNGGGETISVQTGSGSIRLVAG